MLACRRVILALILIAPAAWADAPQTVPAERCPEQAGAPEYLITADLETDARKWQAWLAVGWQSAGECVVIELSQSGTRIHRLGEGGPQTLAGSKQSAAGPKSPATELRVRRRGTDLIVSAGDRLLARAMVEGNLDGGVGTWAGSGCTIGEPLVQPLGEITFDEDFFEREQVPSRWETRRGSWEVGVYYDPLQEREDFAPGACWYQSGDGECLTAAGHWFWDSYTIAASVRLASGSGGLACHVTEEGGALAFVIGEGEARIVQLTGDAPKTLARTNVAVPPDQWCRLGLEVFPGCLVASVDGERVLDASVPVALTGQAGLVSLGAAGGQFDDVQVRSLRAVREPLGSALAERWLWRDGTWEVDGKTVRGRVKGGQAAALRAGEWTDCSISARVKMSRDATAGLVTHHEFGDRAYLFTLTAGASPTWHLHAVSGGETEKLAEGPAPIAGGEMRLSWLGGRIECFLNGQRLCRTYDFRAAPGRAGVYLGGGNATFSDFTCTAPERAPERAVCDADGTGSKIPALQEKQMVSKIGGLWRRTAGRWTSGNTSAGPAIVGTPTSAGARLRYYKVTPGDPRVVATLIDMPTDGEFGLALCAGADGMEGYRLRVDAASAMAYLDRDGTTVAEVGDLQLADSGETVELLRDGKWVVARLGAWQGLAFRDTEPLESGQAEVHADGGGLTMSRLVLTGDDTRIYAFDRPEPSWRAESGTWTDHTGMACILWNYWMSGDGREEPALTWNRDPVAADVTVDVQVAEYTEGYEDGAHTHFPYHDAKVIIGGRPGEPNSGYAFVVGADGGARTVLLREGVEVASSSDRRFAVQMGGHCNSPRAVDLRVTRHGAHLSLDVSGRMALEWDDPDPLPGGHVGLGLDGCRANFRDCAIYPDLTWLGDS